MRLISSRVQIKKRVQQDNLTPSLSQCTSNPSAIPTTTAFKYCLDSKHCYHSGPCDYHLSHELLALTLTQSPCFLCSLQSASYALQYGCFHTAASTILLKLSLKPPMASYRFTIKSSPYCGLILSQLLLWPKILLHLSPLPYFNPGSPPVDQTRQRICLQCRRPGFDSWVRKIPWRRK